jgi:hypothetical protein
MAIAAGSRDRIPCRTLVASLAGDKIVKESQKTRQSVLSAES